MNSMRRSLSTLSCLALLANPLCADTDARRQRVDSINAIDHNTVLSDIPFSDSLYKANLAEARALDYMKGEAASLMRLGLVVGMAGDHEQSTVYNLQAIGIYEREGMLRELSSALGGFGYGIKRRDLESALQYMRRGIRIAEENTFRPELAVLYDNFGVLKQMQSELDSAETYYRRSLGIKRELADSIGIPYSLNKLFNMAALRGAIDEAWELLAESDSIRAREAGDYGRAENTLLRADMLAFLERFEEALPIYRQALELNSALGIQYFVQYCHQRISELNDELGNHEAAYRHHVLYTAYKDSALNRETNEKVAELQIAFESEQKDRRLAEQEAQLQRRARLVTLSLSALALVAISLLFYWQFNRLRQARLRAEMELRTRRREQEMEQKIHREKTRISKELHDNVGSNLSYLVNSLDNLEILSRRGSLEQGDALEHKLSTLGTFGREAISDLRTSIWVLGREQGDGDELAMKLSDLATRLNSSIEKPRIELQAEPAGDVTLSSTQMLQFFRLAQEALQNAIKHADAEEVRIRLWKSETEFCLEVRDDGKGFDPEGARNEGTHGNGLDNMRLRSEEAGARFELSSDGKGTCIRSCLPLVSESSS